MSTLDIACARCEKKFRVRAEFAGRSTRCPGCSSPITIAAAPRPAPPPKPVEVERPRPRPRNDDEEDSHRPVGNWRPVAIACRREQTAVMFALVGIFGSFFSFCLANIFRRSSETEGIVQFFVLLLGIAPVLVMSIFGLTARAAALGVPREAVTRGSAMASLLCNLAGLVCLIIVSLLLLNGLDSPRPSEVPIAVGVGGLIISGLGAMATFLAFIAQVGIAR